MMARKNGIENITKLLNSGAKTHKICACAGGNRGKMEGKLTKQKKSAKIPNCNRGIKC